MDLDEQPAPPAPVDVVAEEAPIFDAGPVEAITELIHLSLPNSRQMSPHAGSHQHDEITEAPATSSSPKVPPPAAGPDTSSDPPDELPLPPPQPAFNVLLKEQTSALLLSLENAPQEDPAAKRKARIGRKRVRALATL